MAIRKNIRNMTNDELTALRNAFEKMMAIEDNRGYAAMARIHGIDLKKCKHGESGTERDPNFRLFLVWHRAYLYWFEKYLQDAAGDSSIGIPYWNWASNSTRTEGIPKGLSDPTVNGKKNPLFSYHVKYPEGTNLEELNRNTRCHFTMEHDTHRETEGTNSPNLVSQQQVNDALSERNYGFFSDALEELHNSMHQWIGGRCGDMAHVPTAAFDPIFWIHHCTIDRMFWLWQQNAAHIIPLMLYDEVLDPFRLTVRQVINVYELGYDYAGQQVLVGGTNI